MRQHKGIPPQKAPATAHDVVPADNTVREAEPAWLLETACCCPARPAVRVVMPASDDRPRSAELLLCGHHFRNSREALIVAGASVYDRKGSLISSGTRVD
jgi:hypothetical protein